MKMSFDFSFTIHNQFVLLLSLCMLGCMRGCVERERLALLDFTKSFTPNFTEYSYLSDWGVGKGAMNCCTWSGISCDRGHVISLDLYNGGLVHYNERLKSSQLGSSLVKLQYLKSLNLSGNDLVMRIPNFFGSFSNLTSLTLSNCGFFGLIPPQLGNLSNIQTLDLSGNSLSTGNLQWLSRLSSLKSLDLSQNNFNEAKDWVSVIKKLPFLSAFICESCYFPSPDAGVHHFNFSSSLQTFDLDSSYLDSQVPFPDIFHDMISLGFISLPNHPLQDGIFNSIGNLCNLTELYSSGGEGGGDKNQSLTEIVQVLSSGCATTSLEKLGLYSMNLTGVIPPMLSMFQSLTYLDLSSNCLQSIPNTHPIFPANLINLYLLDNNLSGVLSDLHFTDITQIQVLNLANNPNLKVTLHKPLAEGSRLYLTSCNLGPTFPSWLLSQNSIDVLDISQCMISDTIPFMFWKNVYPSLNYLNLSYNSLRGALPNILPLQDQKTLDFSSNALSGAVPFFLFMSDTLYLSNNMFTKFSPIPVHYNLNNSHRSYISLAVVDISNNYLSGPIPDWLGVHTPPLTALVLANNSLSGTFPNSIGRGCNDLQFFAVLNLNNNNLSGLLPSVLKYCITLKIIDLGGNKFSGFIPPWLGHVQKYLSILSLRSNSLTGTLPISLCHLGSLQVLDISHNMLSGNIPSCIHNFTAMATDVHFHTFLPNRFLDAVADEVPYDSYFNAYLKWKSKVSQFQSILPLVKLIDLSSNNLSGHIPQGLTSLLHLELIDLSCNSLQGSIPRQIGQLRDLEYFNLSHNRLNGQIPASLAEISWLGMLDVSHNNLSGRIPTGTQLQGFDPSAYAANQGLCGPPLGVCPGDKNDSLQPSQPSSVDDNAVEDKWTEKQCLYGGLGIGFAFGLLGILASLNWISKFRHAFFQFATELGEWMMLVIALTTSRISRKLCFK